LVYQDIDSSTNHALQSVDHGTYSEPENSLSKWHVNAYLAGMSFDDLTLDNGEIIWASNNNKCKVIYDQRHRRPAFAALSIDGLRREHLPNHMRKYIHASNVWSQVNEQDLSLYDSHSQVGHHLGEWAAHYTDDSLDDFFRCCLNFSMQTSLINQGYYYTIELLIEDIVKAHACSGTLFSGVCPCSDVDNDTACRLGKCGNIFFLGFSTKDGVYIGAVCDGGAFVKTSSLNLCRFGLDTANCFDVVFSHLSSIESADSSMLFSEIGGFTTRAFDHLRDSISNTKRMLGLTNFDFINTDIASYLMHIVSASGYKGGHGLGIKWDRDTVFCVTSAIYGYPVNALSDSSILSRIVSGNKTINSSVVTFSEHCAGDFYVDYRFENLLGTSAEQSCGSSTGVDLTKTDTRVGGAVGNQMAGLFSTPSRTDCAVTAIASVVSGAMVALGPSQASIPAAISFASTALCTLAAKHSLAIVDGSEQARALFNDHMIMNDYSQNMVCCDIYSFEGNATVGQGCVVEDNTGSMAGYIVTCLHGKAHNGSEATGSIWLRIGKSLIRVPAIHTEHYHHSMHGDCVIYGFDDSRVSELMTLDHKIPGSLNTGDEVWIMNHRQKQKCQGYFVKTGIVAGPAMGSGNSGGITIAMRNGKYHLVAVNSNIANGYISDTGVN
jgi:hypothetical protein